MAVTYINKGSSFKYNLGLNTRSIIDYTDGTEKDISFAKKDDEDEDGKPEEPKPPEQDEPDAPEPQPEPSPTPEPEPEPEPEPQPEPEDENTIVIESKCTSKVQKANNNHPKRHATTSSSGICLTEWHNNFNLCMSYAKKQGIPIFLVWSNGASCGHCCTFKSAVSHSTFVNYMKNTKIVWCYMESTDSDAKLGSNAMHFTRGVGGGSLKGYRTKDKSKLFTGFPFVCLYWYNTRLAKPKILKDVTSMGDTLCKQVDGKKGATNTINWLKDQMKNFKSQGYDVSTAIITIK